MDDVRATLDQLIRDRGDDYASLSRLLGRNAAYVQQFIHRGVPRKLDEDDRRTLAEYFGVAETILGGPALPIAQNTSRAMARENVTLVPRLEVGASAGPGALDADDAPLGQIGFETRWLRQLTANPGALSIIQVSGDSMNPTLTDGDDILVDRADAAERIRDGIYVLRVDESLIVKRLAINPAQRSFTVRSDNPAYPDWNDVSPDGIDVVGRVIWTGRRIK
jgi:phage repressor protein C with HTH and peptisase S24 domain